jgi:phage terminase large subunit GpA-like protein
MRSISKVFAGEIDKFEPLPSEGRPLALAEERMATFPNSLSIRACSPTWAETSEITRSYNESDKRKPFCKCPACGTFENWSFFRNVHWTKTDDKHYPETAKLVCSACKHEWTEQERRDAIARKGGIRWRQTREFLCCGEEQKPEQWEWDEDNQIDRARCKHCNAKAVNNQHAGFHISKLCAPQISIVEIAQRFIAAKHSSEEETATFYNTVLGEAYKASSAKIVAPNILAARAEDYATEVPKDVVLLTFASDVQYGGSANEGRFEVEVVGWGLGMNRGQSRTKSCTAIHSTRTRGFDSMRF